MIATARKQFRAALNTSIIVSIILLMTGCAAKKVPVFFPALPAPPRVELLMSFNNEDGLRNNTVLRSLIGEQTGDTISKAFGLAFHAGKLYFADSGKASKGIGIVDFEQRRLEFVKGTLIKPMNLDIDKDGTRYIIDRGEGRIPRIAVYNAQNQILRSMTFNEKTKINPTSVLIDEDRLLVTDAKANRFYAINKQTGEVLDTFGADSKLGWPVHISKTIEGNYLVTETGAQSLRLFSPTGEEIGRIGKPGDRSGNFSRPKATVIDRDGNIYAVDVAFSNVQIFNKKAQVLMSFGFVPGSPDNLLMPAGIAINYDRMDIFQKFATPGFNLEYIVAVSSQGTPPYFTSKISIFGFGKMEGLDYSPKIQ